MYIYTQPENNTVFGYLIESGISICVTKQKHTL